MNTDFLKYLFYLCLVIFFFCLLLMLAKKRRKTGLKTDEREVKPIRSGNTSVFFDASENVVILAYITDLFGVGKASGAPMFLNAPYSIEQLGAAIRSAMSACDRGLPSSDIELMNKLGFRSWKDFSKGKRNMSIHYKEGKGVVLNSTIRKQDGAYQLNLPGYEKVVSPNVSDAELGKAIKEILHKCRC